MRREDYSSNYLTQASFHYYLEAFRQTDPMKVSVNLNIPYSEKEQYFLLTFFTEKYKVHFPDFSILPANRIVPEISIYSNAYAKVLLLRYLLEGTFVINTGTIVPFGYLSGGRERELVFARKCEQRLGALYEKDPAGILEWMKKLHGVAQFGGDYSFDIEIVPGISVRFILGYDGYTGKKSQIQFSDNFSEAFSAEDGEIICDIILDCFEGVSEPTNF